LGKFLDQLNCTLNSTFVAGGRTRIEGNLQLTEFGGVLLASIMISVYESFRPVHRRGNPIAGLLARSGSFFLLLGQRFTAGFSTPIHYVFITWSAASAATAIRGDASAIVPAAEHIWSTLISVTLGYLGPTVYFIYIGKMDYLSLSIWQPFPVYLLALNLVLPSIIRSTFLPRLPVSRNQSRKVATFAIAALCTIVSITTHWELITHVLLADHGVDIRDIFLLRAQPADIAITFAHAAHALFVIDFWSVLAINVIVVLRALGGDIGGAARAIVPLTLITVAAGPGAALIISWATAEMSRQSRAADAAFKVKSK
jgi:hypothetical protein